MDEYGGRIGMAGLMTVWTDGLGGWMDGMIDRRMN